MFLHCRFAARRVAFTLVELMVVTAIIAILTAIIAPALYAAKAAARRSTCAFNLRQMGIGLQSYVIDSDGMYPQTKSVVTQHPEVDDNAGQIELPDHGSPLKHLGAYTTGLPDCPSDHDPDGSMLCTNVPNANPETSSYLFNGYLVWGRSEYEIRSVPDTVLVAERRSYAVATTPPNCDVIFRPWFDPTNPNAPWNDMDPEAGAIATHRHASGSNYLFADNHTQWFEFRQVWNGSDLDRFTP